VTTPSVCPWAHPIERIQLPGCAILTAREFHSPNPVPRRTLTADMLAGALQGQRVSHVTTSDTQQFVIHFANATTVAIDSGSAELNVAPKRTGDPPPTQGAQQPTKRQFEYLAFIAKYIARFGRSPAESDIERHFLVSAPSVNQMMQTLERLGFITRQRGVPRSIRICIELPRHTSRQ
jgi:LexA DNA binding domain